MDAIQAALADNHVATTAPSWFNDLARAQRVPSETVPACLDDFAAKAPVLRALLIRAADGEILSDADEKAFFGVHILALGYDTASFAMFLQLLRQPDERLYSLFGDAITKTLPKAFVNLFDGDAAPVLDLLADRNVSDCVRDGPFSMPWLS